MPEWLLDKLATVLGTVGGILLGGLLILGPLALLISMFDSGNFLAAAIAYALCR